MSVGYKFSQCNRENNSSPSSGEMSHLHGAETAHISQKDPTSLLQQGAASTASETNMVSDQVAFILHKSFINLHISQKL